ncbi:hypothetical protein ACFL2O_04525 [Thermodesulfobacteriota bacterium]
MIEAEEKAVPRKRQNDGLFSAFFFKENEKDRIWRINVLDKIGTGRQLI